MKYQLLKNIFCFVFNLDLSLVRAVYFDEKVFGDFADDITNYSHHQRHLEIAAF